MQLPKAPGQYDLTDQANLRGILERADNLNQKKNGDIIIQSANGKRWKIVADNSGVLSTVAA